MEKIATRVAYGNALAEYGADENIFVLDADLSVCTMSCKFKEKYPQRFFNSGIAEANMIGVAAGMATTGKTVFVNSFAMFIAGRGFEQIRNSVAYPNLNVKLIGTHAGLSVGEDGATHQCLEDIGTLRTVPNVVILCPCDNNETKEAVKAAIGHKGPVYIRLGRSPVESVTEQADYHFELGKGIKLTEGKDITIIASGLMVQEALKAAVMLKSEHISARVIDLHTVKPIDKEIIIKAATETGAIITAEEHNINGGLGSAVAEVLVENCWVPMLRVGVNDVFGHSGTPEELAKKYGISSAHIVAKAKTVLRMKKEGKS
ncbi:MAG: transketolase family protein [Bacillota bacterium]|jgi:transketolase